MKKSGSRGASDRWLTFGFIVVFLVVISLIQGCSGAVVSDSKAVNAAKDAGYTDIKVVDKAVFFVEVRGCGKSDSVRFTVQGTNIRGEQREFYVCASFLKGGTIRSK